MQAELQDDKGNAIATEEGYGRSFNAAGDFLFYWVDTFLDGSGSVVVREQRHIPSLQNAEIS